MAKVYLKLKDALIKEIVLSKKVTTIGRTDSNDIQIDNLAVSGSHARIIGDGDTFVIEDLNSTNGTYLNDSRVSRQLLLHDAVITIGKHSLIFFDPVGSASVAKAVQDSVLKGAGRSPAVTGADQAKPAPTMEQTIVVKGVMPSLQQLKVTTAETVGVLTVLDGPDRGMEHLLRARLTTIGASSGAEVRLRGLFAPKVAALIKRVREGYSITPSSRWRKLRINGAAISGEHPLKAADIVEIASLRAEFSLRDI